MHIQKSNQKLFIAERSSVLIDLQEKNQSGDSAEDYLTITNTVYIYIYIICYYLSQHLFVNLSSEKSFIYQFDSVIHQFVTFRL